MRRFLALLMEHPELLFIAVVWIAGMLGQLGKLAKKRAPVPSSPPSEPDGALDADAVAREMRRILRQPEPVVAPAEPSRPPAPVVVVKDRRPRAPWVERPPTPVMPSTAARRLPLHGTSHVGEAMEQRSQRQRTRLGERGRAHEIGDLGGRSHASAHRASGPQRYALDDLKRAFVLAEVLGPPLAIRRDREV